MNIYHINLNLLKAFDALLQTRNVCQAATMLSITQPAMSNLLIQLRQLFSDEILIRRKKEMIATQKALALAPQVREALKILEQALSSQTQFEPTTNKRTFTIATNDYVQYVLLTKLIERLEKKAPLISLKIISIDNVNRKELYETEGIDIGIGLGESADTRLQTKTLFIDDHVCVARKKYPKPSHKSRLSLKDFLSEKHMLMRVLAPHETSLTEHTLTTRQTKREIKIQGMQILPALETIQTTNLIGVAPRLVAMKAKKAFNLQLLELPFELPSVAINMVWHTINA